MANPFAKIIAAAKQKADEQQRREERLKQLEEAENHPDFHFPNPIQTMKNKKEMKWLRKEIAAYKENQRRNRILIGIGCFLIVMFIFIGIMIVIENAAGDESATDTGMYPEIPASSETVDTKETTERTTEETEDDEDSGGGFFDWLNKDVLEFEFELNSDGKSYTLLEYNYLSPDATETASIPDTYEGLPVTIIADQAFYACTDLEKVIIPEGITTIGEYAFYHCDKLSEIKFPSTLRIIKRYAFEGCDSLTSVDLGWSVNVGFRAFFDCAKLETVVVGNANGGTASIDDYAFNSCKKLKSAKLEGVTSVGENAFQSCERLTEVYFSTDLYQIGASAFEYCKALGKIYFRGTADDYNISYGHWWIKDTGNIEEIYAGQ